MCGYRCMAHLHLLLSELVSVYVAGLMVLERSVTVTASDAGYENIKI